MKRKVRSTPKGRSVEAKALEEVRALLGIPEGWATCAHLPIGFPEGAGHGPLARKPVERVAFLDAWARPLFA